MQPFTNQPMTVARRLMVLAIISGLAGWNAPAPCRAADVLATLKQDRPRIYASADDFQRLKVLVHSDPTARDWYDRLQAQADEMLSTPTIERGDEDQSFLNAVRRSLDTVTTMAGLYRLDGDENKLERARAEMMKLASLADWCPHHFLDTAESMHAMAVGYDWLYHELTPDERATVREAIIEKGLKVGLVYHRTGRGPNGRGTAWPGRNNNWNQVCNAGILLGAVAVADEAPEIAAEAIEGACKSMERSAATYDPDGGWPEGPDYWMYGTGYFVNFLAAARKALGADFGFEQTPGLAETGMFRIHSTGPFRMTFNFADAGERVYPSPAMLWLARTFQRPEYAAHEWQVMRSRSLSFLHLLWWDPSLVEGAQPLSPDALFRNIETAFFRGAWDDERATYVGFKADGVNNGHSHLDMGSFVLDADGIRWAVDLGPDRYQLPQYFNRGRYDYFRLRNHSHNTLTINGHKQRTRGRSPIVAFHSSPQEAFAVADLSPAYVDDAESVQRGMMLIDRRHCLVQDELIVRQPSEVQWNMFTRAEIELAGERAVLSQGESKLYARILSPAGAEFSISAADAPLPEKQQPDVRSLSLQLQLDEGSRCVVVLLSPGDDLPAAPPVESLEKWIDRGRLE